MEKAIRRYWPVFVLPTLIAFIIGFVWPFIWGAGLSFCKFTTVKNVQFAGLSNYAMIWSDNTFTHAFWFTAVFTVVSILVLAITRPFVKKKLTVQKTETNSRALIGKVAKVIQPIDNLQSQGRVMVEDMDWSARSENGEPIDVGEEVLIKEIQGVKLIVEKIY